MVYNPGMTAQSSLDGHEGIAVATVKRKYFMPLSWNEIRRRAIEFSKEYHDATRENAETQSFYNDFFNVFGITRRRVASFEEPVKKLGTKRGRIDLFWKGTLLVEQKSGGRDLDAAYSQALDYFPHLKEEELPRYILVSDFQRFELYDLETKAEYRFSLAELHTNVELFGFIAGYQKREFRDQDPVNIEASERMGKLYDALKEAGYDALHLELFLVRVLFCLFADDTGIFEKDAFRFYLEENTREDGSDTGLRISHLFQVLNTSQERRGKNLNEALALFPYVNGSLFADTLPIPDFNSTMRQALISACYFNWGQISPAIFGSLFQSVMDKEKRRGIGAHYTSEKNILKIIKPLFLDELRAEFERIKHDRRRVQAFHDKIAKLTFLDPACGCGNFLILAYRELRLLEIEVLKVLYPEQLFLDVAEFSRINVDAFYGIEIEEFPARIAEVALWLTDHQMNMQLSQAFGLYYVRIPLKASAHIIHDNALKVDWEAIISKTKLSYILGNPPYIGKHYQTKSQKSDLVSVLGDYKNTGDLDYIVGWFYKAAEYIQGTTIPVAFVTTNSITQGEQVSLVWPLLFEKFNIKIHFAHRTFPWASEARGRARVHVVIIGFAAVDTNIKYLFDQGTDEAHVTISRVSNISPYLTDGPNFVVTKRQKSISNMPEMRCGSKPSDGGNLILSLEEKNALIAKYPQAGRYIRDFIGAEEFLNGSMRWCLWLVNASPSELRAIPEIMQRVEKVREFREQSNAKPTRDAAKFPSRFFYISQPNTDYLLIPEVSSERRHYIPIGIISKDVICSNKGYIIADNSLYIFGVLSSIMHMAWTRQVAGRLESRYQYSGTVVYNTFPWPQPTPAQVQAIEKAAQGIIDARALFPSSTLADLYDPLIMPPELLKAHQVLDRAVDAAYRKQTFDTERHRIEYLFGLYQQLTSPLMNAITKESRKRK
jgi:hypothetical protein